MFSNDLIDVHEGLQGINEKLTKVLKIYPRQFSRLLYYENLPIVHLFDAMHIGKNVIETLWKILDGRHEKEKLVKICNDIHESNHALNFIIELNSNGNWINTSSLPWLLMQQQIDVIK